MSRNMHNHNQTPEQHWTHALRQSLTIDTCHSCRRSYPVIVTEHEPPVTLCPACKADLTEQVREWLGLPMDAGAGEV